MNDESHARGPSSRCIACGAATATPTFSFTEHEVEHAVVRCAACGHLFLDGWDTTYDIATYDYYAPRLGRTRDELYDPLTSERLRQVLAGLRPTLRGRVLDIGCGEGQLVDAAMSLGFDARGIDVAEPAIAICRSFGLPCTDEDVFGTALDDERFDIITLVETIEHVPEPKRMLERARGLLAPDGVVWLTTPNVASLGRRILGAEWAPFSIEHLSYFTPRSLERLARAAGYRTIRVGSRTLSVAAVRKLMPRRRPGAGPASASAPATPTPTGFEAEQAFRHRLARSPALRAAKTTMNAALSATGLGETLVAELRAT